MGNLDAAQPKGEALAQLVHIEAEAGADFHRQEVVTARGPATKVPASGLPAHRRK
jgi:hypothetical protein